MRTNETNPNPEKIVIEVTRNQLQHLVESDSRCRGLQLPEGILLRYTLTHSLYFYLRTKVIDGDITTHVFASDSPYDQQKSQIGEVRTPMLDPKADYDHLEKLKRMLHSW